MALLPGEEKNGFVLAIGTPASDFPQAETLLRHPRPLDVSSHERETTFLPADNALLITTSSVRSKSVESQIPTCTVRQDTVVDAPIPRVACSSLVSGWLVSESQVSVH